MAALFTTPKRNDKTSGAHFVEPDVRRRTLLAHGSWRRVTRRIVVGAVCALTVSSLLMPSVSLAAEWMDVGGVRRGARGRRRRHLELGRCRRYEAQRL